MNKGDIIKFGKYPQRAETGSVLPIEWIVLDVTGNEALLISRYALDCELYHHEGADITWEDCDLRKWLNSDFLKSAFSEEEVQRILVSDLKNDDNPKYHTQGGNDTKDRLFCLSISEAEQYLGNDKDRKCVPTAYTLQHNTYVDNGCCCWWLRSPGFVQDCAACVLNDGALCLVGCYVDDDDDDDINAVRPALRIICNQ